MKIATYILLLSQVLLHGMSPEATSTWIDPVKAAKENAAFTYIGEYKSNNAELFHQVTALNDGNFLVTSYSKGLPGRGWDKTVQPSSESLSLEKLQALLKGSEKLNYQSPTLGKKAPKSATLTMPDGFTNVRDGILWAGGKTTKKVGSFKMHLEFRLPFKPKRNPSNQDKGNSGIYIYNNYEIQVLDSFALDYTAEKFPIKQESHKTQWCGCLYKMKMADVNMSLPPLVWQTYDIEFTAPVMQGGKKIKNARLTVLHNGVKIHDNVELKSGTGAGAKKKQLDRGLIYFQDHSNPTAFRNVWIVETQSNQ